MPNPESDLEDPAGRRIDEALVRSLHALLSEASVSGAAMRLGISQPALSRHLKALRELTGDPLLVRVGNRMVATEKGQSLLAPSRRILADLALLSTHDADISLKSVRRTFRLAMYDFLPATLFAELMKRLNEQAPSCDLVVNGLGSRFEHYRQLADGEVDLVITLWPDLPPALRASNLLTDELVCLMRRDNPLNRAPWTIEAFARARHLSSLEHLPGQGSILNSLLGELGLTLDTAMRTQFLSTAPAILESTDLVFSTGRLLAQDMAAKGRLVIKPFPVEVKPMRFKLVWHERTHKDRALMWLRSEISAVVRALRPGT
ncbi:LysR substrate-binding domain-containing protein [soil metagenome]